MSKKNIEDIYPLSPIQKGILFHSVLNPEDSVYVTQICLTLQGNINSDTVKQTWQEIINRHQVCRAAFRWEKKDKTFQVIYKQVELPWQEEDWQQYSAEKQENKLREHLAADKKQGFNLKRSPLIRISLIRLTATTYKLVWTQHHIILDGWSSSLILKEFFTIYNGYKCQASVPYSQYIAWLNSQDIATAENHWRSKLQDFVESTSIQVYGQQLDKKPENKSQEIKLSSTITDNLKSLAAQHDLTLNTIIQGAFAILLSRYSNSKDTVYGTTTSGRPASFSGTESMVGLFINTLPMRVKLTDTELLLPWLKKLQQQQIENLQYEYTSLATVKDLSSLPPGIPLFENIFVFENYPIDTSLLTSDRQINLSSIEINEYNNFPLTCLVKVSSKISITIQYKSDRFDSNIINRILESFEYLLAQITKNIQQPLGKLSILTQKEQDLIESWQQTQVDYDLDKTIPELFKEQVNKTPDRLALIFEDKEYTYQELNDSADELASYLIQLGVKPETPVGIYLERSEKIAIAILAIIKASGVYVPLDPDYPINRIDFIIQDTETNIILTETKHQDKLDKNNLNIINLDLYFSAPTAPPTSSAYLDPNNAAYIIYTSGSTGKPKGVVNTHKSLVNRLLWMQDAYKLNSKDKVLQKTPFSFDVSDWEFFWTWLNGACLVMAKPEGHKDSNYLVKLIAETKITVLHFVPSMLDIFLEEPNISNCKNINKVICSGEALLVATKNKFFTKLDAQLHNLYGPTEAAIDVTAYQCHDDNNHIVPIGKAIANTQIYILNSQQQLNPIGVPGELHIGGIGFSRGYLNRPELTAEKFIPNPFSVNSQQLCEAVSFRTTVNSSKAENNSNKLSSPAPLCAMRSESFREAVSFRAAPSTSFAPSAPPASLLYKTGDLARYTDNGEIEYLGRIDNNIKVRGFRIELGEINAVLKQCSLVKQAVTLIRDDIGLDSKIVAYLIPEQNIVQEINRDSIKSQVISYLEKELPYYMIPNRFVFLTELPLNSNGKLDRKSLPKPAIKTKTFIPPRNDLEQKIAVIWQEVLQLKSISVNDNFFELGGNSFSATRVNSRLVEVLSIDIPLRTIFEKPTVSTIAQRIKLIKIAAKKENTSLSSNVTKRHEIEI
ncbi:MAG: amino acid adenylation domain-containing protein [Pleurocapsa sp.]